MCPGRLMDAEAIRRKQNCERRHCLLSLSLLHVPALLFHSRSIIRPVAAATAGLLLPRGRAPPPCTWRSFVVPTASAFLAPAGTRRRPPPRPRAPAPVVTSPFIAGSGRRFGSAVGGAMGTSEDGGDGTDDERPRPVGPPPLIDADCNLLHGDMLDLARGGLFASTNGGGGVEEGDDDDVELIGNLLGHQSVRAANVVAAFSPASTVDESARSLAAFTEYAASDQQKASGGRKIQVKTSAGVHPYHAQEEGDPTVETPKLDLLAEILEEGASSGIVACVGECGLDYSDGFPPAHLQRPWFDVQLDLACKFDLPVFLHERLAFDDTIAAIDAAEERNGRKLPPVLVHCFTGTPDECRAYVDRGYRVGVTGYVLKSGDGPGGVRKCLESGITPLDRLLIETDAPYMGFPDCRGSYLEYEREQLAKLNGKRRKRITRGTYPNVLGALPMVLAGVTVALNAGRSERGEGEGEGDLTEDEVGRACTRNAMEFFGFDVDL